MEVLHERSYGRRFFQAEVARSDEASAVLFLLGEYCENHEMLPEPCVVFNKRSMKVRQPGDLCFPGGRVAPCLDYIFSKFLALPRFQLARWPCWSKWRELQKEAAGYLALLLATALRESLEEMGLNPFGVKFLGPLPPECLQMFDRVIYPMVGWIARQRHFLLNWEVERIVYVPIQNLLNPGNYACYRLTMASHSENTQEGRTQDFPCFCHETENEKELLWGATYRIVMVFLELVYGFKAPGLDTLPIIYGYLDKRYFNRGR
jgi:8-oxo-dGTP pyrophosphatase MutT (NUDIX family)